MGSGINPWHVFLLIIDTGCSESVVTRGSLVELRRRGFVVSDVDSCENVVEKKFVFANGHTLTAAERVSIRAHGLSINFHVLPVS